MQQPLCLHKGCCRRSGWADWSLLIDELSVAISPHTRGTGEEYAGRAWQAGEQPLKPGHVQLMRTERAASLKADRPQDGVDFWQRGQGRGADIEEHRSDARGR